jgi:hypothetical protein
MSSFHQLKAKRDKRHPVQHVQHAQASGSAEKASGSSFSTQEVTEQPSSGVLPDGVEVKTDEKRGRGLYATKAYEAGTSGSSTVATSDSLGKSVLSTTPLQAVLSIPNLSSACSGCLLTPREIAIKTGRNRSLSPCVGCNVLHFCSDVSKSIQLVS